MTRRWLAAVAALLLLGTAACGGTTAAGGIPDEVMLRPDDIDGGSAISAAPDQSRHPLPPAPCEPLPSEPPVESRTVAFQAGRHRVFEYVARGQLWAPTAVREAIAQCPGEYHIAATDLGYRDTMLIGHDSAAYYIGTTGDYFVAVLVVDDLTLAADYGQRAMARAGAKREPDVEMRTPTEPPRWVSYAAEVTGLRPGKNDRTLLIDVLVPECSRDRKVTYLSETVKGAVHANVVYEVQEPGACLSKIPATVTLTTKAPLGDREIVLNSDTIAWGRTATGYRRCTGPFGCATPPADHCAQGWLDVVRGGMDVPKHSSYTFEHCDQTWLIVSVDETAGECGPVEGQRPGCAAEPRVQRWFLRFETGWQVKTATREAGCPAGLDIPTRLCEGLPAPR